MNDHTRPEPTLVLGGTGKTGRRVVERLTARGLPVRIGSRSGAPPFDWDDRATWQPVLEGVGSAYVAHYWDAIPGAAQTLGSFAELAVASGVRRLVLLSGRGEQEAERAESAVRGSGAELTVLRSTWFAQNFSETDWRAQVQSDEVALPAADTPDRSSTPTTSPTSPSRRSPTIGTSANSTSSPAPGSSPSQKRSRKSPGRWAARSATHRSRSRTSPAAEQGVSSEVVELLAFLFGEVLDGRNARLADGVQRALGRQPRDISDYARDAAATGIWNPTTTRVA
jgi:hypothetical protein